MSWLTILILATSITTAFLLFGMIYFGAKNNKQINDLGKNVDNSTSTMKSNLKKIMDSLESNQEQQKNILNRLENLETIVTSETWDAIKKGESKEHIGLLLEDDEIDEISIEEKAQMIAKRIKH